MIEEFARVLRRFQDVPFRRNLGDFLKGRCIEKTQMRMGVNQSGHQRGAAPVNDSRIRRLDGGTVPGDPGDPVPLHKHLARKSGGGGTVDHPYIVKKGFCHGLCPSEIKRLH